MTNILLYLLLIIFPLGALLRIPFLSSSYFYPIDPLVGLIFLFIMYKLFIYIVL